MWRNITLIRFHARKTAGDMIKYLVTFNSGLKIDLGPRRRSMYSH